MKNKNSILTMLSRLLRLIYWLGRVAIGLRRLEKSDVRQRQHILQQMAASLLTVLHVRIEQSPTPKHDQAVLIVANHISWLDIFVLASIYPANFIAAKELRNWLIVGKMIENAGTVFIDRTSRKDVEPINAAIVQRLRSGENVCFFPEARTSLGNAVLPLKAALFQAAIYAPADVQCVALRYYDVNHQRTEQISFAGTYFPITLWRILSQPEIIVRADFAPLIQPSQYKEVSRFVLKSEAEAFLNQIVLSDSPNPERVLLPKQDRSH